MPEHNIEQNELTIAEESRVAKKKEIRSEAQYEDESNILEQTSETSGRKHRKSHRSKHNRRKHHSERREKDNQRRPKEKRLQKLWREDRKSHRTQKRTDGGKWAIESGSSDSDYPNSHTWQNEKNPFDFGSSYNPKHPEMSHQYTNYDFEELSTTRQILSKINEYAPGLTQCCEGMCTSICGVANPLMQYYSYESVPTKHDDIQL